MTANLPIVKLAWATKKRHIAIDGKVLCMAKSKSAGYSVKNGQYNTLGLSGLPDYLKTTNDEKLSHGDGIINFAPLDQQKYFIDTKSICKKCLKHYSKIEFNIF